MRCLLMVVSMLAAVGAGAQDAPVQVITAVP